MMKTQNFLKEMIAFYITMRKNPLLFFTKTKQKIVKQTAESLTWQCLELFWINVSTDYKYHISRLKDIEKRYLSEVE